MGSFIVNNATVAFWIIYFISWLFVIIEQDFYKANFKQNMLFFTDKNHFRIDNKSNKKIEEIVSNFNSSNKKFLNKITFKNFVNDILIAYFG